MTAVILRQLNLGSVLAMASICVTVASAQQPSPDLLLTNGKIITVDERFTIAEAVAVSDDQIIAVGSSEQIAALATPGTRTIDLQGRAMIPGLIDNHMHLVRAGTNWQREVRWDGVESRRQALDMLRTRAESSAPGEWILSLGGWSVTQFADDPRPFTRAELDAAAPDNPVLLQSSYYRAFLNGRALNAFDIGDRQPTDAWIVRDAEGRPTGEIETAGIRALVAQLPPLPQDAIELSSKAMIADLNRAGLTAFGSAGCNPDLVQMYRDWAADDRLNVRIFCITGLAPGRADQVDSVLPDIARMKLFQGDAMIDHVAFGESVYRPLHDPMFVAESNPSRTDRDQWRRVAAQVASTRLPLHVHANLEDTLDAFLDEIETIDRQYPIRNLRWAFAHANQLNESHLARMKALGMYAAVHPWAVINGGINRRVFGDAAYDMPPLRTIQQSGITWGLGSDGSRANQILPFVTLGFATTGQMVGGSTVLHQTISREDALIAHTRKNAYLIFQEDRLGAIQPGKLADMVVLDRDYLTIPAEQIKKIRPVLTIVGGRIVYDGR